MESFKKKLTKHNVEVLRPNNVNDCNQIFARDLGFVISNMFFLSIPHAWHLAGTWSEQLPNDANLIGMSQTELMMTLHSIFVPLLLITESYA